MPCSEWAGPHYTSIDHTQGPFQPRPDSAAVKIFHYGEEAGEIKGERVSREPKMGEAQMNLKGDRTNIEHNQFRKSNIF